VGRTRTCARDPTRARGARPRPGARDPRHRGRRARLHRGRRPRRADTRRRGPHRLDAPGRQRPPVSTRPRTPAPATPAPGKLPLPELGEMKRRRNKIAMVTAYDAPAALLADDAGVELILVGDTAAMVMLGHESTV